MCVLGFDSFKQSFSHSARLSACGRQINADVPDIRFEPSHDKTNKMICASSKDSDQPGLPPCLISLQCPHDEAFGPSLPTKCTAKTDQGMPRLISVLARRTCHFVGFVTQQLI